jgi:hypothetical protein
MMRLLLSALSLLALAGCNGDLPGEWTSFVFAEGDDRSNWIATPGFQSFGMCKQAASEKIVTLPDPSNADYVCGYQCGEHWEVPKLAQCKRLRK